MMDAGHASADTGVAGTSAAGTGGSVTVDSGTAVDAGSTDAAIGSMAGATLTAVDGSGSTITGTAVFTHRGNGVDAVFTLNHCPNAVYPVHIHQGSSCSAYGAHWDTTRGEGILDISCGSNTGFINYTRNFFGGSPTDWTIGDAAATDLIGHTVVVHAAGGGSPILCGEITAL
jgi:Cu-Zn family superoxide dismutase